MSNTPPSRWEESERACMLPRFPAVQQLGENISHHCLGGAVRDCDDAVGNGLADEVETKVDVFRPGMELSVLHQGDGGLIVTVQCDGGRQRLRDLPEECPQP